MKLIAECTFETVTLNSSEHYTCFMLFHSPIRKPNISIDIYKENHQTGKQNENVSTIIISKTYAEFLPKNLGDYFRNVKILKILDCALRRISSRDLMGFEDLEEIHIVSDCLHLLPTNLFRNLQKLKKVTIVLKRLEFMSSEIFSPDNQFTLIDLRTDSTRLGYLFDIADSNCSNFQLFLEKVDKTFMKPNGSFHHSDKRESRNFEENFSRKFMKSFEGLWNRKSLSDFTVVVGNTQLLVHKVVLALQSSVFSAMFESDLEEMRTGVMTINDFSAESVEEFFRHFYTGNLPRITNAMEMFALSSKYNMNELRAVSEELILDNIDESNAIEVFCLGYLFESDDMKFLALLELKKIHPELICREKMVNNPTELFELLKNENLEMVQSSKRRKTDDARF